MAAKSDLHKVNQVNASTHQHQQGTYMKSYDSTKKKKSDNNCFKCGERGHYAQECPLVMGNTTYSHNTKVPTSSLDGIQISSQIIAATEPPKVVQTIPSEGQFSASMWNTLLTQLKQAQNENKQMKQFVKKYIPYNKRNQNDTSTKPPNSQTNTTPNHNETKTNKDATKGTSTTTSKVNKIETDTNDDMYDTFPLLFGI